MADKGGVRARKSFHGRVVRDAGVGQGLALESAREDEGRVGFVLVFGRSGSVWLRGQSGTTASWLVLNRPAGIEVCSVG